MKLLIALAISGFITGIITFIKLPHENVYIHDFEENTKEVLGIKNNINDKEIIGFLPFWLTKEAYADYHNYVTTVSYFGLDIATDGTIKTLNNPGEQEPGFTTLEKDSFKDTLQNIKNNGAKISLVLKLMDSNEIDQLISKPEEHATTLIKEVTPYIEEHGFTDINIDIETPGNKPEKTRQNFTLFMKSLRENIEKNELNVTLGIDIIPYALVNKQLVDLKSIETYIDYVVLMTYDFHYLGSAIAGPVAPLKGAGIKREYDVELTIQQALKLVPKQKIILGIPLYGYQWDAISNIPGAPVVQGTGKIKTHRQINKILNNCDKNCITGIDRDYLQPYIIKPANDGAGEYYKQIFYEDKKSLKLKLDIMEQYDLGGAALWALGYEDQDIYEFLQKYR